jgi:hypothetical protein
MSIEAVGWVLAHSEEKLGARLVLLSLANHAHADGTEAYPSVATVAAQARLSERQTQYALRALAKSGAITPTGTSRLRTTIYRINMNKGADFAGGQKEQVHPTAPSRVHPTAPEPSFNRPITATPDGVAVSTDLSTVEMDRAAVTKIEGRYLAFDALATACGLDIRNKSQVGLLTKALKDIRVYFDEEVGPQDVSPEVWERALAKSITARAQAYRRRFKDRVELTPTALAKWWHQLVLGVVADAEVAQESRDMINRVFGGKHGS